MTSERPTSVDALAAALGIGIVPESWRRHWPAFCAWRSDPANTLVWRLEDGVIEAFDLPTECVAPLVATTEAIADDANLRELVTLWHFLLYDLPDEIGDNSNFWNLPDPLAGAAVRVLALAAFAVGGERAGVQAAASGMNVTVQRASLALVGRKVRETGMRRGVWGMESLTFHRHYVRGEMFRLGRLTFRVSPFPYATRVWKDRLSGLISATAAGVSPGDNHVELVGPDALRAEVHVPGDGRLDPAEFAASYRLAMELLPPRHARPIAGFTCVSWLLDPTLRDLLPAESNILRFAEPYVLLDEPGDARQAYDLIFGDPDIDPAAASTPRTTGLQRAISDHVRRGGTIRAATGFLPWDRAVSQYVTAPEPFAGSVR